jgi:hypothetical protein
MVLIIEWSSHEGFFFNFMIALVENTIYRMIKEELSIFWVVIASVIVRKKVHINMFLILIGYLDIAV